MCGLLRIEMLSVTQELGQSVKCKVARIIVHHGAAIEYHCPVQYYAYIENTFMHVEDNTFIVSTHAGRSVSKMDLLISETKEKCSIDHRPFKYGTIKIPSPSSLNLYHHYLYFL